MKKQITILILIAIVVFSLVDYVGGRMTRVEYIANDEPKLSHRQEVWLNVLEWCESRGNAQAINPEDRDGTPSYGAFQFKPSTLDYYAEMYGVATTTLMDYETQRKVVEKMILHRDEINWNKQFPDCVKKNGLPPKN